MNFEIAIPTYKRQGILLRKTLNLLKDVDKSLIKIYVEDEEQFNLYKLVLDGYEIIITNTKGIGQKRNFISERAYYDGLDCIVMIDDDIKSIINKDGLVLNSNDIINLIHQGYQQCLSSNARLFGICCFNNRFFMKDTISKSLKFVCGAFFGQLLKKEPLLVPINLLEDYYRTLLYFETDGVVIRFNFIGMNVDFAKAKGGLQLLNDREEQEKQSAIEIVDRFSENMVKIVNKKRGVDLRLNHYFKNEVNP